MNPYFDDEKFEGIDYTKKAIVKGEYDTCTFIGCNFSGIHASNIGFIACEFIACNFSNVIITNTAFKEVTFKDCKLLGLKFNECDPFLLAFKFINCQLNVASFYKLSIPNTHFINCNLQEVDFTETKLSKAIFDKCDLKNAIFDDTGLENVNFTTAFNFEINPAKNQMKKALFSSSNVIGLLKSFDIRLDS
jgi:uncharacterized protein YjbI with pentapeptide repeats